ncbi:MAG: acetoin dehydrogenase dihydrolipoyllysine-residue acetyltransferase subunit [Gammaproteobacteria bacterium]|nr:MAG: acetoin dehydrogenase dihydrolipoyllysine-residue acetyltransferase subunit [Gammaproteobacteria bacterium]
MDGSITPLLMPKWGIDMAEGRVAQWLVAEGAEVQPGAELVEVESEKTTGPVEATVPGVLRRRLAREGEVVPVGALLGVLASASVPEAEIEAFVAGFRAPEHRTADAAAVDQTVEVLGHELRLLSLGAGEPPILLLHGFGGDLRGWGPVQAALARGRRVISVDLPAHGGSTTALASAEPRFFEDLVLGLLEALAVPRVHLVGHSWGGVIAWGVAGRAPERVASLTLIGTAGPAAPVDAEYLRAFLDANRRADLKAVLQRLFADPALVTRELIEQTLRYKRIEAVDAALRRIAAAAAAVGSTAGLPPVPVQIIAGSEDRICPLGAGFTPPASAALHRLPGVGHMPQLEAPAVVTALIEAFVAGKPQVPRPAAS